MIHSVSKRTTKKERSIPQFRLKSFLNPVISPVILANPDPDHTICLSLFPKLGRAFSVGDDFLSSIDPLKSMVNVRCKFISFHQNNDIVYFRSFQSFARIT